ncbi:MAG: pyruvate dehydrogenase (acetyl-transferring) E1 component subunit alpha [Thiohalomonadales bacterium]
MTQVAQFDITYTQYLGEDGTAQAPMPSFANDKRIMVEMYEAMVLTRTFDKKAVALQRTGKLGTYPSSLGQEAISVAIGSCMRPEDVLLPYYREHGAQFLRGLKMEELFLYWGGDERGMNYQGPIKDFPICVPIATHAPHAVGVAYAMKLRDEKRVAVAVCGDGATSKGDFYEAMNAAGLWQLPLVFIVNNNQWAISIRRENQTHAATIAQKAIAAGFDGEQVDGNDIIATRERIQVALDKARNGGGPTLIEALSYRLCDHTTADDASRYRGEDELKSHWKKEPLLRLYHYLQQQGYWDEKKEKALQAACADKVDAAVKLYLDTPPQEADAIFDFMYAELPMDLKRQKDSFNQTP